ncbi:MAG: 30S ribosomal protein S8 [Myxococcota bacterium]
MHTDPVADMLTRVRNGCRARLERVDVPHSKLKEMLAQILKREGFIEDFRIVKGKTQDILDVKIRYDGSREPAIRGIQRVSRPGLRRYMGYQDIPRIQNGQGMMILTTSKGIMTDREARKARLGGEALCAVW